MRKYVLIVLTLILIPWLSHSQEQDNFNYEYALIEAARQKTIGNINESIKLYQKCLEANPESDVVYYELGSIYIALNQADISERLLSRAYELDSDNYWYLLAYSQILNYQKDYKKLTKVLKDYLKNRDDIRVRYSLANSYYNLGKNNKALRILRNIEKEKGISEQIILKKVEILKDKKKYDKAENELLKLLEMFPEAPDYNIIMAEFLEETGNMDKAVNYYTTAYKLDTTNLYAISNLADYYTGKGEMEDGLYYLNRAFTLDEIDIEKKISTLVFFLSKKELVQKHKTRFQDIVTTLLNKYPDNFDIKTIAYDFYNDIEDYNSAYEIINQIVRNNKENLDYWQRAIYTASLLNKYDKIIELGKEALSIFPNKKELKLFIGIAYFQKENFEKAYEYLSSSYEPGLETQIQLQYLTFLAESSYKLEKVEESFYYFEELLLLQPENYMVMNNYSYYMALEDVTLKRAEELSRITVEKHPKNYTYLDTYAWILFKLERYEEAYDYIKLAMENEVKDPEVLFHYAWILCMNGDKNKAIKYFEEARHNGFTDIEELNNGINFCKQ